MNKLSLVASFILVALSTSAAFAYHQINSFRCSTDQLYGRPQDSYQEGRTAFGRRRWASTAHQYWKNMAGDAQNAKRFWLPTMYDPLVNDAIGTNIDLYPVYADPNSMSDVWIGPGPDNMQWHGTTSSQIANLPYTTIIDYDGNMIDYNLPTGVTVAGLCEAGCYSPEQAILVGDAFVPVVEAHKSGQRTLTTLAPNATMNSLEFMVNSIAKWTVDIAPAHQTIITLRMKSGGELRVTTEHPLVTSDGVMKRAEELILGEALVQEDGSPDPVMSMAKNTEFTKVYNLRPTTTDLTSNILVAQGYLTGSARFQNEYLKYLNRVLLRHSIPSAVIVRSKPASANHVHAD